MVERIPLPLGSVERIPLPLGSEIHGLLPFPMVNTLFNLEAEKNQIISSKNNEIMILHWLKLSFSSSSTM